MKKYILYIMSAILVSLSFSSCQDLDEPADTDPSVKTLAVSELGGRKAYFQGTVNAQATGYFLLATTINLVDPVKIEATQIAEGSNTYAAQYTGLTPGTDYYVAFCASDGASEVKGNVVSFTTPTYLTIDNVLLSDIDGSSSSSFSPDQAFGSFLLDTWSYTYGVWDNYSNLKTEYVDGEFVLPQDISLSTDVRVYAYYPYTTECNNYTIPVSVNDTDTQTYLYGNSSTVNADNTDATITFRHALAKVSLAISNTNSSSAQLTKVSLCDINGDCLAGSGTMNVFTGAISDLQNFSDRSVDCSQTLGSSAYTADFMVIPTSISSDQVIVKVVVDGREIASVLPAVTWNKGSHYTYQLSINKDNLVLGGVRIEDWDSQNGGSIDINQN